jgi:hypothetical protein
MNRESYCARLATPILLALFFVGPGRVHAYEYVAGAATYGSGPAYQYASTSTKYEHGSAGAEPYETGYVICSADGEGWAKNNDTASVDVGADALVVLYWTWDGPPGTAPGGTLSWLQDGDGGSEANGWNDLPNGGNASCSSEANSGVEGDGWSSSSWASANANGSATDYAQGSGNCSATGSPSPATDPPVEDEGSGLYSYAINWDSFYEPDDPETVASGTTTVTIFGYASCSCSGEAKGWPAGYDSKGTFNSTSNSSVWVEGTLTPN